jgi:hypothetical protein
MALASAEPTIPRVPQSQQQGQGFVRELYRLQAISRVAAALPVHRVPRATEVPKSTTMEVYRRHRRTPQRLTARRQSLPPQYNPNLLLKPAFA